MRTRLLVALVFISTVTDCWATMEITQAAITAGEVVVAGRTDRPQQKVVFNDQFEVISDGNRKFIWKSAQFPAGCVVKVTVDAMSRQVLIANCGPPGPPGQPGEARLRHTRIDCPAVDSCTIDCAGNESMVVPLCFSAADVGTRHSVRLPVQMLSSQRAECGVNRGGHAEAICVRN